MPETYRSGLTGSIADLMRQQGQVRARQASATGNAEAQRAATSGQVWGQAIQNIGQGVSGTLRDIAQQREQAPMLALRQKQVEQLTAELNAMDTATAQKKIGELAQMVKASGYDPNAAEPVFAAIAKLSPDYAEPLQRSLMEPELLRQVTDTLISQVPGYKAPSMMQRDPTKDLVNEGTGEIVQRGVAQTTTPTSIDAAILAADQAGNTAEVQRLMGLKEQSSKAGRAPSVVNVQRTEVLLDGKPAFAVFNPQTEKFSINGVDVTARVKPIMPQGPAPERPSVWVQKGTEQKYVTPSDAAGLTAQGWGPSQTRENPTEDERKSAGFHAQMDKAIVIMDKVEDAITPTDLYQIQSLPQKDLMGAINRGKMSEPAKRYIRALMQFTEARLRAVSGASVQPHEYEADRQMFGKQYGETPQLNADRRQARTTVLDSLKTRGGRAMPKDAGSGKVKMQAPDGSTKEVDPSEVEHFKSLGAKVVGG